MGRLPEEVTSQQLREAFAQYGEVLEVFLIDSKASGATMLGCAFVRMAKLDQAQRALHEYPGNGLLAGLQVALAKGEAERLRLHAPEESTKEARSKLTEAQLSCAYLLTVPELAELIKDGQRRGGDPFKQKWRSFCDWAKRGTHDPLKHEHRSLVHFVVTAAYEYGKESWFRSRFEKLSPPSTMPQPPGPPSGSSMAWPGMPPWPGSAVPPMPMPRMPRPPMPGPAMPWPGMPPPWAGAAPPWAPPPQPGQPRPHGQPWMPPDQDLGGPGLILPKRRRRSLSHEASEAEDEDEEEEDEEEDDEDDESKPASNSSGFSGKSTDRVRAAAATKASTAMAAKSRRIQEENVDAVSTCSGSEDEDAEIDAK